MLRKYGSLASVENFWDTKPCNINHSYVNINENPLEYSQQVTTRKLKVEPHIIRHANFPQWRNKRVLDLGCGLGTQAIKFAHAGSYVTAVDISKKSLAIAKKRAKAEGVDITFIHDNIETLSKLKQRDFDLVYSFGVIHHTPNPENVLQTAHNVLKLGGEFRFMVYNRVSWKAFWIILNQGNGRFWRWKELIPKYSEAQLGCPITWTFTQRTVTKLLKNYGFNTKSISADHIFPYNIQDYLDYKYIKRWYWRMCPSKLFSQLEKYFGWHLLVAAETI